MTEGSLTQLQVAAVEGFLAQLELMGYDVATRWRRPKNIAYIALCAGYSIVVAGLWAIMWLRSWSRRAEFLAPFVSVLKALCAWT